MEGGRQAAALEPLRTSRSSFTCELFDEAASDVADGGVTLLDTLRVSRGDIQEKINLAGELPTLGLLPLVESATRMSCLPTSDSICREKIRSNP